MSRIISDKVGDGFLLIAADDLPEDILTVYLASSDVDAALSLRSADQNQDPPDSRQAFGDLYRAALVINQIPSPAPW
jgi:hypothetical protein